jgi:hypothetical protein
MWWIHATLKRMVREYIRRGWRLGTIRSRVESQRRTDSVYVFRLIAVFLEQQAWHVCFVNLFLKLSANGKERVAKLDHQHVHLSKTTDSLWGRRRALNTYKARS